MKLNKILENVAFVLVFVSPILGYIAIWADKNGDKWAITAGLTFFTACFLALGVND